MSLKFLACAILLIAFLPISAQFQTGPEPRNGHWWLKLQAFERDKHIVGMFDGVNIGYLMASRGMVSQNESKQCFKALFDGFNKLDFKLFNSVKSGELVQGVDAFYRDYRNKRIYITNALWVVLHGIAGTPQKELDSMTEEFRREAAK